MKTDVKGLKRVYNATIVSHQRELPKKAKLIFCEYTEEFKPFNVYSNGKNYDLFVVFTNY